MANNEGALRNAAKDGDLTNVSKLLAEGTVQKPDENGDTPLLLATSSYATDPVYVEIVRELLDHGADINVKNKAGDAAIHNATSNGNLEITELLLEHGADIELEGEQNIVPLGLAASRKQHAVVSILLKKLLADSKFSEKQVKWAYRASTEQEQMTNYRALMSIFSEKAALREFAKYRIVDAILRGMRQFSKKNIQTTGLQLLITVMGLPEGAESARELKVKDVIGETCQRYAGDPVVEHLVKEVLALS